MMLLGVNIKNRYYYTGLTCEYYYIIDDLT